MISSAVASLRHQLHKHPELSGRERNTARTIVEFFSALKPDNTIEELGGHGLAFVFAGNQAGPTVLLRCDMDALPICELNTLEYRSDLDGVSHKCGHDGHMAILAAVGEALAKQRPSRGRVVLLYQPAEENGEGAAAVLADPKFTQIKPDFAFALHNLPGYPLGQIILRPGSFNCASRGMCIRLEGRTAHAAQPETGLSPARLMCQLVQQLPQLPPSLVPEAQLAFVTVVGARLGDKAFGTAPGKAEIWATLRSETNKDMRNIIQYAETLVRKGAAEQGLQVDIQYEDVFPATVNSEVASKLVIAAAGENPIVIPDKPFRWSEDFGRIAASCEGALFGIGAGQDTPDLHNPDYDFPDALLAPAKEIFMHILQHCLRSNV